MGGKGSGGTRVGAGRKPQSQAVGELKGSRRSRARASGNQTATAAPNQTEQAAKAAQPATNGVEGVLIPDPPGSLTLDELAEWNDLAPLAAKQGTLTNDMQWALVDLCRSRVLLTKLLRDINRYGNLVPGAGVGTVAANPLLTRYTTLSQRIDAGMLRFKLAPIGKTIEAPADKPADPFSEFDGPSKTADGETVN